jgi:DNA-binding transcriptional LysR family regulator
MHKEAAVDIRHLRFFMEIARLGNFTKAAERLHVAQPAVSMAIKDLEEELELTLFNRSGRRVSLTAEGEIFLGHAQKLLDDLAAAHQQMADLRGLGKGEVRVGIPPMLSAYYFPDIICDFTRRYPNLHLSIFGEGASRIQKMITAGEIDMGVVGGNTALPEELESRHLIREEVVVCVPAGHPFAGRSAVTLSEFAGERLVFYKEGYYLREFISGMLKEFDQSLDIVFETNLFSLVKSLVMRGLGISVFLKMVVAAETDVVAIPFDPPLYLDLELAWKKNAYLSRANQAFVDFLIEHSWEDRHPS